MVPELLFGGARGGGKSDYLLGDYCADGKLGPSWRGVVFRQSYPELEELIGRSQTIVPQCWPGSEWFKQEKTWHLPTGATLRMRNLETAEDAAKYQGHSYSWVAFDELCAWPDDRAYRMLSACLRSAEDVPHKRIRASANPGGPGHAWVKARFIDPAPQGYELIRDELTGIERMFIPSRVTDNRILMARDPGYVDRLRGVGSPELVRAWLEGDWSAVVGSYFPEFGLRHVVKPFRIPPAWLRFRAMDWGSARPFCVQWFAVSDGIVPGVPSGALVLYREWYGASAPNVGLRLTAEQVADGIRERELGDEPVAYGVADPAIFASDGGPSIAERFHNRKIYFKPADNKRVGKLGHAAGWDLVRQRLIGEDGLPMLYVFATARDLIRTLPALQHDPVRPEDLDSSAEDHAADVLRYACASRPWIANPPPRETELTLDRLFEIRERERRYG
jgi:terminase large subunit-like protein